MDRTACTELQCLYKAALYLFFFFTWHVTQIITKVTGGMMGKSKSDIHLLLTGQLVTGQIIC